MCSIQQMERAPVDSSEHERLNQLWLREQHRLTRAQFEELWRVSCDEWSHDVDTSGRGFMELGE